MNSREYAKHKRLFVGPILPNKIRKQRNITLNNPFTNVSVKWPSGMNPEESYYISRNNSAFRYTNSDDPRNTRNCSNVKYLATPIWANKKKIKEVYETAKLLTENTGVKHSVDHIIPLRHALVCGLHVESNLRIVTHAENVTKSNLFVIE